MDIKKWNFKLLLCVFSFLIILNIPIITNAAIQMVPSTTRITNVTIDQSFVTCRGLDSLTSTLRFYKFRSSFINK